MYRLCRTWVDRVKFTWIIVAGVVVLGSVALYNTYRAHKAHNQQQEEEK